MMAKRQSNVFGAVASQPWFSAAEAVPTTAPAAAAPVQPAAWRATVGDSVYSLRPCVP